MKAHACFLSGSLPQYPCWIKLATRRSLPAWHACCTFLPEEGALMKMRLKKTAFSARGLLFCASAHVLRLSAARLRICGLAHRLARLIVRHRTRTLCFIVSVVSIGMVATNGDACENGIAWMFSQALFFCAYPHLRLVFCRRRHRGGGRLAWCGQAAGGCWRHGDNGVRAGAVA